MASLAKFTLARRARLPSAQIVYDFSLNGEEGVTYRPVRHTVPTARLLVAPVKGKADIQLDHVYSGEIKALEITLRG
jgi:hypothetical protein